MQSEKSNIHKWLQMTEEIADHFKNFQAEKVFYKIAILLIKFAETDTTVCTNWSSSLLADTNQYYVTMVWEKNDIAEVRLNIYDSAYHIAYCRLMKYDSEIEYQEVIKKINEYLEKISKNNDTVS